MVLLMWTEKSNWKTVVRLLSWKTCNALPTAFASFAIRKKLGNGVKSGIIWHTQGSGKQPWHITPYAV